MQYRGIIAGLAGLVLASAAIAADGPSPAPSGPPPAAGASTPPKFLSGSEAEFPDAARAAGEFGKVIVSGVVGVDGKLHDAKVEVSSRSTLLDASALAAANAAVFDPARDAKGVAFAKPVRLPYNFDNAHSPGKGGGALRYRCDQFARDYDWWYRTWPADQHDDFYSMVLGYVMIARMRGQDYTHLIDATKGFDSHWRAAVEACRSAPDKYFLDIFQPEGEFLKRLAGG